MSVVVVILAACKGSNPDAAPRAAIQLPRTMQAESKAPGDDASLQRGVAWPSPRFTPSDGGATVVDRLTGLMWAGTITTRSECGWQYDWTAGARRSWQEIAAYVECLNAQAYLGHSDWRMPNRLEMRSLLQSGWTDRYSIPILQWFSDRGFEMPTAGAIPGFFVTSTVAAGGAHQCAQQQTKLQFEAVRWCGESEGRDYTLQWLDWLVWPVRDAEGVRGAVQLPASGVTACYDEDCNRIDCAGTGQDGETRRGVAWPSPRFVTNRDTTVTDRLTGLVWGPNGNLPSEDPEGAATTSTWLEALAVVDGLNARKYLGHADWRLPNLNELATLTLGDVEARGPYSQLRAVGVYVKEGLYWSSTWASGTSDEVVYDGAWSIDMANGGVNMTLSDNVDHAQLLPVRGP